MRIKCPKKLALIIVLSFAGYSMTIYNQSSVTSKLINARLSPNLWSDIGQIEDKSLFLLGYEQTFSFGERYIELNTDILAEYTGTATYPKKNVFKSRILDFYSAIDLLPTLFMEMGKKHVKSGTAYFKSPSDFFDSDPDLLEKQTATAYDKTREGVWGIGLQYLGSGYSVYQFISPAILWKDNEYIDKYIMSKQRYWQNYTKLSFKTGLSDIDLIYYGSFNREKNYSSILGINGATLIKDKVEIHLDGIVNQKNERLWVLEDSIDTFRKMSDDKKWIPQFTTGLEYSFNGNFNAVVEYYFNGKGQKGNVYKNILQYTFLKKQAGDVNAFDIVNSYGMINFAKNYLMQRISFTSTDKNLEISLSNLQNIHDGSGLINPRAGLTYGRFAKMNLEAGKFYGGEKSEMGIQSVNWFVIVNVELFII